MPTPMPTTDSLPSSTALPKSMALFEEAQTLIPGGVNSPVRAFGGVGGTPVFMARAQGPYLWDVDGNRYVDYVGSWGPMILGHGRPEVMMAVQEQAMIGFSFGTPTQAESELAKLVIDMVPGIEMVRFVSSGTEAVMSAVRLARAATGRSKIVKFAGNYHGHMDALLIQAGSGASTLGVPNSAGVPEQTVRDTLSATFNDLDSVRVLFETYPGQIAAVLVEPVAGNMGCVPPAPGFLEGLRELTARDGALLVFDEVMTGFRVHPGGVQARYGVTPDLTTLGKVLGGGLPVGAYGGRREIMAHVAPLGSMYQAGTLSGNPLAMASGRTTLGLLKDHPEWYDRLAATTEELGHALRLRFEAAGIPVSVQWVCGMLSVFFLTPEQVARGILSRPVPVDSYEEAKRCDGERFKKFFHSLLSQGVYLPPSAYEAWFLSTTHTSQQLSETLTAVDRWLTALQ